VVATAAELARFTGQHLIAPQTILVRAYLEQVSAGLRDAGLDVFHVVLDAGLAVDTGCRTPAEIAHQIADALPEPMRTGTP
jgi:hypothetical protein